MRETRSERAVVEEGEEEEKGEMEKVNQADRRRTEMRAKKRRRRRERRVEKEREREGILFPCLYRYFHGRSPLLSNQCPGHPSSLLQPLP